MEYALFEEIERERERELQGVTRIEMSQRLTSPSVETPGALRKSELSI